jgi:hypothetical protein
MIRLSMTSAAFDALAATLPLGSIAYEPTIDDKGERSSGWNPASSIASAPRENEAKLQRRHTPAG